MLTAAFSAVYDIFCIEEEIFALKYLFVQDKNLRLNTCMIASKCYLLEYDKNDS